MSMVIIETVERLGQQKKNNSNLEIFSEFAHFYFILYFL